MRPSTIRKLIELVEESQIEALEVTSWWRKVKITRKHGQPNGVAPIAQASVPAVPSAQLPEQQIVVSAPVVSVPSLPGNQSPDTTTAGAAELADSGSNLIEITSPMVGTYYASPSPDSPVFVKIGDQVDIGTVVCIVEAMKLMNEIESECKGTITKILVENAQPIEFGQPLFLIDPA